jgi:hypothetical protein
MGWAPNAEYWRSRAEEAVAMAKSMRDPVVRKLFLDLATEYFWNATKAASEASDDPTRALPTMPSIATIPVQ